MSKKRKFIIIICAIFLLIVGSIGFQKYSNITNPHKAFEKDLSKPKETQELQKEESKISQEEGQPEHENSIQQQMKLSDSINNNVINILLLGVDSSEERESMKMGYRSDSIIVTSVSLDTKEVKMLSIPRDTYTEVPGKKTRIKSITLWHLVEDLGKREICTW